MRIYPICIAVLVIALHGAANAGVVWSDNYNRANSSSPNPYDFTSNGADDYTVAGFSTAGISGSVLNLVDTGTSTPQPTVTVPASQFDTTLTGGFIPAGGTVRIQADLKVTSISNVTGASVSTPRFVLNTGTEIIHFGLGVVALSDGDANNDLALFVTPGAASSAVSSGTAVGFTGSAWQAGFDLGDLSTTTATDNNTNDQFYRFDLTFTVGSTAVTGNVTNLGTAQVATANRTLGSAFSFTNGAANHTFQVFGGQGGQSAFQVDNISIDIVPEPSALAIMGLAGAYLLRRGRRNPA